MPHQDCSQIRSNAMLFIDNELSEENKAELICHLNHCKDCQEYYEHEQDIKSKICLKIKDSYICQFDESKLKTSISEIISNEIN